MARRKLAEENVRSVVKIGNSYGITLPLRLLKKLGWREKQKVTVKLRGKTFIVKDWP